MKVADRRAKAKSQSPTKGTSGRPEAIRIRLLGGFETIVGARTIEEEEAWRLRKAASLVKLLALASGHRLHREQAMDLLWPDLGLRTTSNSLRQTLHAARRILDPNVDPNRPQQRPTQADTPRLESPENPGLAGHPPT